MLTKKTPAQLQREIDEALAKPRRRGRTAHATIKNRDDISSHTLRVLGDQLEARGREIAAAA